MLDRSLLISESVLIVDDMGDGRDLLQVILVDKIWGSVASTEHQVLSRRVDNMSVSLSHYHGACKASLCGGVAKLLPFLSLRHCFDHRVRFFWRVLSLQSSY